MPYLVARNGRPYSDPRGLKATLAWISKATRTQGRRYRINANRATGHLRMMATLTRILPQAEAPRIWHVYARVGDGQKPVEFLIKKVPVPVHNTLLSYTGSPVVMDKANPRMREIGQWLADEFTHIRCNGWSFKRVVSGTNTWSQHSPFPPVPGYCNAGDFAFYKDDTPSKGVDTLSLGEAVTALLHQARSGTLPIGKIIYQDQVWNAPDFRNETYTGTYHGSHFHVEAYPKQTGEPV